MTYLKEVVSAMFKRQFIRATYHPPTMLWNTTRHPQINPVFMSVFAFDKELGRGEGVNGSYVANAFIFDFDNEKDPDLARRDAVHLVEKLQTVYDISPQTLGLYWSGKKGFHILLPVYVATGKFLLRAKPSALENLCDFLASGFSTYDTSVYDHRRILRIPGALHGNRRKIQLSFHELCDMPLPDMRIASAITTNRNPIFFLEQPLQSNALSEIYQDCQQRPALRKDSVVLPIQAELTLSNHFRPAANGTRNNAMARLVGLLAKHIQDIAILTEIIRLWNSHNETPLMDYEILASIRSIFTTIQLKENQRGKQQISRSDTATERPGSAPNAGSTGTVGTDITTCRPGAASTEHAAPHCFAGYGSVPDGTTYAEF